MGEADLLLLPKADFLAVLLQPGQDALVETFGITIQLLSTRQVERGSGSTYFSLSTLGSNTTASVLLSANQQ